MTISIQQAIETLERFQNPEPWEPKITDRAHEALQMAISALEKQIPKKPKRIDKNATFDGNWKKVCPACGRVLVERITTPEESYPRIYNFSPHCICGQAIKWEEEA